MSQKKLKKLRKVLQSKTVDNKEEQKIDSFSGFRQILKENWKFLLILIICIFGLYWNSLNGAFVSDDYATVTQDASILDLGKSFQTKSIPTIYKSLIAVNFGITNPFPFHLTSLIMYVLVCVAAFVFLTMIFDKKIARLTLILFAVLPIHVEAVSWISGEPYLLMAFFILMSLIFFALFLNSKNKKYLLFLLLFLLLLLFTDKFRGFSVVLLGFLYLICFGKEKSKVKVNLGKIFLIALGLVLIIGWPMINARISAVNGGYNGSGDSLFYNPIFQYPLSVAKYLQLMLFPTDLTLYHTMYIIPTWLNWMIFLSYIGTTIYFFFKDKKIFFALGFIFLAAAASMSPVKVGWLVAERYLFLGSLGFCLFLVLFFLRLGKKWEILSLILMVLFVGLYGVRVYLRNDDWQTNHKLWVRTVQVSPNSHNAWNNIGDDYDKLAQLETTDSGKMKQYENAVKGFTQSTVVKQNYADAYHNRANIFYKMGRLDMARDSYETALSYSNNNLFQSLISLVQIDLTEKRVDLALGHVEKLQKTKPNDLQVYYITAVVYANAGMRDQAIQILDQILKAYPTFTEAKTLLSQLKIGATK